MESDWQENNALTKEAISIHALRMESDSAFAASAGNSGADFYPRSPHGERHWISG